MDPARTLLVLGEGLPQQEIALEGQTRLLLLREHLLEQPAALSDPVFLHVLDLLVVQSQLHISLQLTHFLAYFLSKYMALHQDVGNDLF